MSEDPTTEVLKDIREQLNEMDCPAREIEVEVRRANGSADCTCGVCGSKEPFGGTHVVDPDEYDYDQWDSKALNERDQPLEHERLCRKCANELVANGGRFDKHRYEMFTQCDDCNGRGAILETEDGDSVLVDCETCDGTGVLERE